MRPKLRHLHLRTIIPYHEAQSIQHSLVTKLLAHKAAAQPSSSSSASSHAAAPLPTLLTFTTTPTYTTGRREHESLSQSQLHLLQQPLDAPLSASRVLPAQNLPYPQTAQALSTLRGGLTTFHGPGQLVIYPTLDLISPHVRVRSSSIHDNSTDGSNNTSTSTSTSSNASRFPRGISPRCYISLLESASIATLAQWGIHGVRTENPGVWVVDSNSSHNNPNNHTNSNITSSSNNSSDISNTTDDYTRHPERKLAAVGVHLRRNVTSFGVGLNVDTDLRWFDRIVACGLEGKGVGSMAEEIIRLLRLREQAQMQTQKQQQQRGLDRDDSKETTDLELNLENVARVWASEFASGIWGDDGEEFVERVESVEELWEVV
ncbi:hypothetical protein F5884DRAFT_803678 [Xylogone sp. PMI_703]|nr:hypothetical protein F5884DRAFT_803678 [Xylogone sp. PMI_703]